MTASREGSTTGAAKPDNSGKTLCALGLFVCVALMLSLPLSYVWLGFDVFTHFALQYMLFGASFLIACLVPRWRVATAVILVGLSFAGIGLWARSNGESSSQVVASTQAMPGMRRVRIMTFNTWLPNTDWKAVASEIRAKNPDIVTLVEFDNKKAPLLKALKVDWPYQVTCQSVSFCHMVVLSKIPYQKKAARTRWVGPPYLRVSFGRELGGLTLFAIHTIRPPHYRAHLRQVTALAREINRYKGLKLAMGDFNSTPYSRTLSSFTEMVGLKRLTSKPTWPSFLGGLPQIGIDHIFVSPAIKAVRQPYLGASSGSDHFPVNAVVAIPVKQ